MRIGVYYKWYKEGKLNCTQEEISKLWKMYEDLSYTSSIDRQLAQGYMSFLDIIHNPSKYDLTEEDVNEEINSQINRLNSYFRLEREEPKVNHLYILQ